MASRKIFERFVSISLLECCEEELDEGNTVSWRLSYPNISTFTKSFIESRLTSTHIDKHKIDIVDNHELAFYHLNQTWIYLVQPKKNARRLCLALVTTDLYPYTYSKLLVALLKAYVQDYKLKSLMHEYLNVMIYNRIEVANICLDLCHPEPRDVFGVVNYRQVRSIIELFHLDIILIYTALLLRRRVAIYHHRPKALLDFVQALPAFLPHRPDCLSSALVPNVDLSSSHHLEYLKSLNNYIATFVDAKIEKHEELYDLYINLAAVEITIAHNVRSVFTMTKTHKDVAVSLVRAIESSPPASDKEIVSEISRKTYEILNVLYAFVGSTVLSSEGMEGSIEKVNKSQLKQKMTSATLLDFYWNLAIAEGIAEHS